MEFQSSKTMKAYQIIGWKWGNMRCDHGACDILLFICLFGVFIPLENFALIWRRHHYRWRATHPDPCWALSEGFLAKHIYRDTWHPFIKVISEDQWHSHLLPSVCQCSYHYLFLYVLSSLMKQTGLMLYKQQLTKNNLEEFSERNVSKGLIITDKSWGLH